MRKLLLPFTLLLYSILHIGCTTAPIESKQPIDIIPVQVKKVKEDTFIETIALSGLTRAKQEFPVLTTTPMLVEEVYTKLGQKVNQGDRLIRFANSELKTQLVETEQRLKLLEQALNHLEQTSKDSLTNWEQLSKQYKEAIDKADALVKGAQTGAVTMLDLLESSTELLLIQNQLQALGSLGVANGQKDQLVMQHFQAKQQLQALEQAKEQLLIKAPFAGVVTMLTISANEVAMPHTPLVQVANTEQLMVHVQVNNIQLNRLRDGMQAKIWFEDQVEAFTVPIHSISVGNGLPGSAYAEIILDNPELNLVPGQFVKVEVETERTEHALHVPVKSVSFTQDKAFVFTVKENIAKRQLVTLGNRNDQYYHVLTGLAKDDVVIVQGQERVMDGSNVYIQK